MLIFHIYVYISVQSERWGRYLESPVGVRISPVGVPSEDLDFGEPEEQRQMLIEEEHKKFQGDYRAGL